MKKIVLCVLLLLTIFTLTVPHKSYALNCALIDTPDVSYNHYDGVIIGTVQRINVSTDAKILTVNVEKSLKGVKHQTITIKEDLMWGESQVKQTYLYFLDKKNGLTWIKPLCSPSTTNTGLVTQYLADKEEITLRHSMWHSILVNIASLSTSLLSFIVITVAFIVIVSITIIVLRRKGKKK